MLVLLYIARTAFIFGLALALLLPPSARPMVQGDVSPITLPTVHVDPLNITDPALTPSENITIKVKIANVTDLAGFDIQLRWNASLLSYTGHLAKVPVEDHPEGVLHEPVMQIKNEANATAGTYWAAFATLAGPSFNGSGIVFTMNFTIIGFGECALDITSSDLSNSQGAAIVHTIEDGYFSNAFYDIAILDIAPSSSTVLVGEIVNITVIVQNNGTTRKESFNVTACYDTTPLYTEIVVDLPPSAEAALAFHWNTSGLPPGDYVLSANATSVPGEASTENNRLVDGIVSVIIEPVHDIAVISIAPCKTIVCAGYCLCANITLENQGSFTEMLNVTLYANYRQINSLQAYLNAGMSATVTFAWNTTDAIEYQTYVLNATLTEISGENDTSDNSLLYEHLQVVHPGDFDGDLDVDIFDIVMLALAYGATIGDTEYDSNLDLDCDGEIDIFDIVLVTPHYGYKKL